MTTEKLEYDAALGGSVRLGTHVPTYRYAASVVQELKQLLDDVRHPTSRKLVFQTLPKHMRRRAMSHHPKRLPRRYRTAHRAQMAKAGKPQPTKRPSRKHRRRPHNLLREYIRRQRRHVWLETHIWHARRFHMVERWGYRLPYASCDKTYRACYRATAQHCLLQDISFHACIELQGKVADLRAGFAHLSSAKCGLGIAAKTYLSGQREGSIELFAAGRYPEGALGRVQFMWQPLEEGVDDAAIQRTLWLWVHPSAYQAVLEELIKQFELVSTKTVKIELNPEEVCYEESTKMDVDVKEVEKANKHAPKKISVKAQRQLQFMTKTLAYERIKRYANNERCILLSELKDTMNRFRLTGPLAQSVLANAFKVKALKETPTKEHITDWLRLLIKEKPHVKAQHQTQAHYWQQCGALSSPAELMSNMIIALNIEDPRINRPQKRTKAQLVPCVASELTTCHDFLLQTPSCLPQSALWRTELRDHICEHMLSTQTYGALRSKHAVVPGARCQFEEELQPVPVLLIQRPGSQQPQYKRLGYGCGWDVIAPAGYGMPIWLALIMWGAKPGGLREFDSLAREMGTEQHLPDTVAGRQLAAERHTELRLKYFRRPPNKRCNYSKFAVVSPFRAVFGPLLRDWTKNVHTSKFDGSSFYVLRDRALLLELQSYLQRKCNTLPQELTPKCLVQLQLRMKSRGSLADFALICLPTRADFKRHLKQIKHDNHEPIYTEPILSDVNEKERKDLRKAHKRLLRKKRAKRVQEKRSMQEKCATRVHIRPANTARIVAAHFKKMCALYLPEKIETLYTVRRQCTREVFGYVTTTSFSFTEATVCAVGYVVPAGLQQLITLCQQLHIRQPMCLVRSPDSRHYYFANFKLNLDI